MTTNQIVYKAEPVIARARFLMKINVLCLKTYFPDPWQTCTNHWMSGWIKQFIRMFDMVTWILESIIMELLQDQSWMKENLNQLMIKYLKSVLRFTDTSLMIDASLQNFYLKYLPRWSISCCDDFLTLYNQRIFHNLLHQQSQQIFFFFGPEEFLAETRQRLFYKETCPYPVDL